jgi:O-acetyl-ADP-ribose deacetylase (regulator of RNase III)
VRGDIAVAAVDVVVNAANERLARGGGVCGAIFAAAGPELDRACAALGGCATGDAVATPGFALGARWIVHTVGPVWRGGANGEPEQLASCYRRSLEVAGALQASSVAFPAISTGIFGYPLVDATRVAVAAVRGATTTVSEVRFVCFDDAALAAYRAELGTTRPEG